MASPVGKLLFPSLSDLFFVALILWLFVAGGDGWKGLLLDGDSGWHIRTGEYILNTHSVPTVDLYSFTKAGQPWFAWEWLSDVWFAVLYGWAGLKGVTLAAGVTIAAFATILLRRIFDQGANLFAALAVGLLAVGAASIHFHARPHLFTLLLLVISLWMIEADRKRPTARLWLLVPLTILWTNLHGGFIALLLALGACAVGTAIETWLGGSRNWSPAIRYGAITVACAAATLVNPYGIQLHIHIASYLQSDWIRNVIQEFQSPSFRSENMMQFEALLFLGVLTAAFHLRRGRVVEALWILGFAHLALSSVRHVPLYVAVTAPVIAAQLSEWMKRLGENSGPKSVVGIIEKMGHDLVPGFARNTVWPCLAVAGFALAGDSMNWPKNYPEINFPIRMVREHPDLLKNHRVFSFDQWGDYLIFNDPTRKVFIDGRSDFFGAELGNEYLNAFQGRWQWRSVLDKYAIDVVLAPSDWPLVSVLKLDTRWRVVADDGQAVLFSRHMGPLSSKVKVPGD